MALLRHALSRLGDLRVRLRLWRCARVGRETRILGRVWVHGGGRIVVGERVTFDGSTIPIELHALPGAEIHLGDEVYIEGGTSIEAECSVRIGARARLGGFCKVMDNHFHPLRGDRRQRPPSKPVVVEEDVRLGERAILLPGAFLQRGATVLAGSVVSRRVPAGATFPSQPGARGGER